VRPERLPAGQALAAPALLRHPAGAFLPRETGEEVVPMAVAAKGEATPDELQVQRRRRRRQQRVSEQWARDEMKRQLAEAEDEVILMMTSAELRELATCGARPPRRRPSER
jgi:hypothetical protein